MGRRERVEFGDWQTPLALARASIAALGLGKTAFGSVLEPTCGRGAFLVAAADAFPRAQLVGREIDTPHAKAARTSLASAGAGARSRVEVGDFFRTDWSRIVATLPEPILVTGNPPWVTNAGLGVLGSSNLPPKANAKGLSGLDAMTGKSNFDVSEWMIARLLDALVESGRRATLAMLCKSIVARRIIETIAARRLNVRPGGLWKIDALEHFDAAVDAVLFVLETGTAGTADRMTSRWPAYPSLTARAPDALLEVVDGVLVADAERFARTRHLAGTCDPEWRSGIKHDCARVMELESRDARWFNGLGDRVDIESDFVFPLLKSSDVANDRVRARAMIVPQRTLGEDTRGLARRAPKLWRYLTGHRALLEARKSSIYRGQPPFAIFGVGPYAFAPWKVAISGLYKRCAFTLVAPSEGSGQPVVLDDTCYFLPFASERAARRAHAALGSPLARDFFTSRVFWDAKRPITKALLQSLDLATCATNVTQCSAGQVRRGRSAFR